MAQFKDDKFTHIKSDIEKLRKKPTMYISYIGSRGALHLAKEAINNAWDEAFSNLSPCDDILIAYNVTKNMITVQDNGRGIPFDQVEIVSSYLQAGSNIDKAKDKENAADLAGDNGVGLTAVNALSDFLIFKIKRNGELGEFRFEDGILVDKKFTTLINDERNSHGTLISFVPSETYLKKCNISAKELRDWINEVSYTIPSNIRTRLLIIDEEKNKVKEEEFVHKNGIVDLMDEMVKDKVIKTIYLKQNFPELKTRSEIAFNISQGDTSDFTKVISFCNRVSTIEKGTHVEAAKNAWCRAITKIADEIMTENDKKKYKIQYDDCRIGLANVTVLFTPTPLFTGQTKQKVDNSALFKPLVNQMYNDLIDYLHSNPSEAKKIVTIVKNSAKARQEVVKIRKSDYARMDSFEAAVEKGFIDCLYPKKGEIWALEGDSSLNQFKGSRDYRYQAGFKFKGNPKNVYGLTIPQILANQEMKVWTKVLGAGIGTDFDIRKLRYDKIILFPDSDIDGYNIGSLWSAYFLWVMPQVVQAGKLYRAIAPLYMLYDKKHPYVISKNEYYELFADTVSKNMRLVDLDGNELNRKQMIDIISKNKDYYDEIIALTRYYRTHNEIIEFSLLYYGMRDFGKLLQQKFPDLRYHENEETIDGEYKSVHQYITLGKSFKEKCKRLYNIIHDVNEGNIYYRIIDKGEFLDGLHSLGSFFIMNQKYLPSIDRRIKGIGELPGEVLWETTLNPKNRELLKLTCNDLERELEIVRILHGSDTDLRKEMMKGYVFNKDDIDT